MRLTYLLTVTAALAGQALATVNVIVNNMNMTAADVLNFTPSQSFVVTANCTSQCNSVTAGCSGNNDNCICTNTVGMALLQCEQCLFTYIVDQNLRPSDPLLGSQYVLDGFVAGCLSSLNTTIQPLQLTLPPSWDGPQSNKLSLGTTIVAVAAGAIIGSGALYIFSNIE